MDLGLAGKNAVITGSTRGIGRAIANLLADEGTNLAICSRNQEEVDSAVAELSAKGVKVTGAVVDVADKASYQAWIASVGEELGGIDIFVPNVSAGGGNMSEEGWEANFNVDLLGTTRGVEAAMPFLEKSSAASIVVISSTAGVETFMGPQPYNAIKGALVIHAKQLSQALAPAGIRVNCVSPGVNLVADGGFTKRVQL